MGEFLEKYMKLDIGKVAEQLLPVVLVLIVCLLAIKVIMSAVKRGIKKTKLEKGLHSFIENTIKVILYFITVLIIADMLNIPINSLIATFSVVGLAASLAIQDSLANLASGVMILVTHPFKCGDYIEGAGASGTVVSINFTHTVLLTIENIKIHIPNKQIVSSVITNYSEQPKRRIDITFNISYSADIEKVKKVMRDVIDSYPKILPGEPIFARVTGFQDSAVDYTLRVWVRNQDYWNSYYDILELMKKEFDKNGIEIPFNQLDVNIKKD